MILKTMVIKKSSYLDCRVVALTLYEHLSKLFEISTASKAASQLCKGNLITLKIIFTSTQAILPEQDELNFKIQNIQHSP